MIHVSKPMRALLAAVLLTAAAPAAIYANESTSLDSNPAGTTALNQNLLQNAGFESVGPGGIPTGWTASGHVKTETFGTRSWPYPAYGAKYDGGQRYLTCRGGTGGSLRQTVNVDGYTTRSFALSSRMEINFGGTIQHKIRVAIRAIGQSTDQSYKSATRVLDITDHYKKAVVTLWLPQWVEQLEATVELLPADGAGKCKMVADSVNLWIFRPS